MGSGLKDTLQIGVSTLLLHIVDCTLLCFKKFEVFFTNNDIKNKISSKKIHQFC